MKLILYILSILLPMVCIAQDFTKEVDSIPVEWNGRQLPAPWTGGSGAVTPELVDIDADGDLDLFHGDYNGYIWFYENIGDSANSQWQFISDEYADIFIGPEYYGQSSPEFVDIDGDGDYDLLIGKGSSSIHYYENVGNALTPLFEFITDSLWGIITEGINRLGLVDINNDGDVDLFIGEWDGTLMYWGNTGGAGNYDFTLTAIDLAGNQNQYIRTVIIDNTAPIINITNITADPMINFNDSMVNWNLSTSDYDFNISGFTSLDIDTVCFKLNVSDCPSIPEPEWECQMRCSETEMTPCINNTEFTFSFTLNHEMEDCFSTGSLLEEVISVKAIDKAINENREVLYMLLDWKQPELLNVSIT